MMKTKFNFWGVMAAAAIILSAGAGYASSTNQDEEDATHYNAETDPTQAPRWEPILPDSPEENECTLSSRPCKAIETAPNVFSIVAYGTLE